MPLWSVSAKMVDEAGVISVQMRDHDRVVRVDIKHEVLIGGSHLGSRAAVRAFEMNRDLIERRASAKYDSSEFITYANGVVVSISGDDWELMVSGHERNLREREAERLADNPSLLVEDMRHNAPTVT